MLREVLYASNNPGKIIEVSKLLNHNGIKVVSPKELNIELNVPETGVTLRENAVLKAQAFSALGNGRIVLADDTGLEIDALNGEPGIRIRRWKDGKTRMTDEEIIAYCLELMKNIDISNRGAQFRTVVALNLPGNIIETFDGTLRGTILETDDTLRVEGFPFESLFYVSDWNMLLGNARELKVSEMGNRLNHREKALKKAIPKIRGILK